MGWAAAFLRHGMARVILAALLLGLSACGNTIPDTGATEINPQDALREAPLQEEGVVPQLAGLPPQTEPTPAEQPLAVPASENLFCPILRYPLLNDLTIYPNGDAEEPPPREPFYDSVFGSCLARLTDRTADLSPFDSSTSLYAPGAGVQAFNANSTRILVQSSGGYWYVYNAETLLPVLQLPTVGAHEVFWDPVEPFLLYFLRGTSLLRYGLHNGEEQLVHDFSADFANAPLERISALGGSGHAADGRHWGLAGLDASGNAIGLLIYNLAQNQVTAHLELPDPQAIQGLRISASGAYLVASFGMTCPEIQANGETPLCGLLAFDRQLTAPRLVTAAPGSFDTALDATRQEVVVYHDQAANSISTFNLNNGEQQALLLLDASTLALDLKISGRASSKPGWALASVYSMLGPGETSWLDGTILVFELKSNGMIARLAMNNSIYAAEDRAGWIHPGASPNPDFTRVVFNSNWGSATGEVEAYIIALPDDWANPGQ